MPWIKWPKEMRDTAQPKEIPATHVIVPDVLTPEQVTFLRDYGRAELERHPAMPGTHGCQRVLPQFPEEIYARIWDAITAMNERHFQFELWGIAKVLYAEYPAGAFIAPHIDETDGTKLAFSIQLSDDDEYEGGELQLHLGSTLTPGGVAFEPTLGPRGRGVGVLHQALVMHSMSPVTRGVRRGMVAWTSGPRFR